jgi:hypothetical protein
MEVPCPALPRSGATFAQDVAVIAILAAVLEFLHAVAMAAWVLGLPLLFWHRWPRLTRVYAWYAISFVVLSQGSQWVLGDCFLTTWTDRLWDSASPTQTSRASEWLTVRLAQAIFHLSPSHRAIVIASETLAIVSAVGMLVSLRHLRGPARATTPAAPIARTGADPAPSAR